MNKSKLEERRAYVKEVVNKSARTKRAVSDLADQLFLSERTIWEDLRK